MPQAASKEMESWFLCVYAVDGKFFSVDSIADGNRTVGHLKINCYGKDTDNRCRQQNGQVFFFPSWVLLFLFLRDTIITIYMLQKYFY